MIFDNKYIIIMIIIMHDFIWSMIGEIENVDEEDTGHSDDDLDNDGDDVDEEDNWNGKISHLTAIHVLL